MSDSLSNVLEVAWNSIAINDNEDIFVHQLIPLTNSFLKEIKKISNHKDVSFIFGTEFRKEARNFVNNVEDPTSVAITKLEFEKFFKDYCSIESLQIKVEDFLEKQKEKVNMEGMGLESTAKSSDLQEVITSTPLKKPRTAFIPESSPLLLERFKVDQLKQEGNKLLPNENEILSISSINSNPPTKPHVNFNMDYNNSYNINPPATTIPPSPTTPTRNSLFPNNKPSTKIDHELKPLKTRDSNNENKLKPSSLHQRKRSTVTLPITIGAPNGESEPESKPSIYAETSKHLKRVNELQGQINYYEGSLEKTQSELIGAQNEVSKYKQLLKSLEADSTKKDFHIKEIENKLKILPNQDNGIHNSLSMASDKIKLSIQDMQLKIRNLEGQCEASTLSLMKLLKERNSLASELAEVKVTILELTRRNFNNINRGNCSVNENNLFNRLNSLNKMKLFVLSLFVVIIISIIQSAFHWLFTVNVKPFLINDQPLSNGNWWDGTIFEPLCDYLSPLARELDEWAMGGYGGAPIEW